MTSYPKPPAAAPGAPALSAEQEAEAGLEYSFAGRIGKALEPALAPMGFDWKIGTAMLGAMAAKEVFVAQLGIVYSLSGDEAGSGDLRQALRAKYSSLTAFCVMLFMLIAAPCMATFAVTRMESGSVKWAVLQWFGLTGLGWVITTFVYQTGSLLGL